MFEKKHLRGDPDLPFNNDPAEIESLLKRHVPVTHEPLWFYRSRGTSSPAQEKHWHDCTSIENIEVTSSRG